MRAWRRSSRCLLAAAVALSLLAGGCSNSDDQARQEPVAAPSSRAAVPQGWLVQQAPGFTLATPPEWVPRPQEIDAVYSTAAGTSVRGTPVAPVTVRQRELLVETRGLPKYGLRFTATLEGFDEQLWQRILSSVVVTGGGSPPSPSPRA